MQMKLMPFFFFLVCVKFSPHVVLEQAVNSLKSEEPQRGCVIKWDKAVF